jgi:two-component system response regulator HydG
MNLTPLDKAALKAEYDLIVETLKKTKFNKSKAAVLLQIDRKTLYNKLTAYEKLTTPTGAVHEPISTTH